MGLIREPLHRTGRLGFDIVILDHEQRNPECVRKRPKAGVA